MSFEPFEQPGLHRCFHRGHGLERGSDHVEIAGVRDVGGGFPIAGEDREESGEAADSRATFVTCAAEFELVRDLVLRDEEVIGAFEVRQRVVAGEEALGAVGAPADVVVDCALFAVADAAGFSLVPVTVA